MTIKESVKINNRYTDIINIKKKTAAAVQKNKNINR